MKSYIGTSDQAVLIMTGIGGSENGYENKYEKIAYDLNVRYGVSVFIFATPRAAWGRGERLVEQAVDEVRSQLQNQGRSLCELYCFGVSADASFLGAFGYLYLQIKKLILVNPVIQINYHKFLNGLKKINADVTIVFGELDPSYKFLFMLDSVRRENIKTVIVPNADHCFSGEENFKIFLDLLKLFFNERNNT